MMQARVAQLLRARVTGVERIQSLWSGYGELARISLDGFDAAPTAIVKHVHPPTDEQTISHARKRRSYDVELAFYRDVAPRCDATCRVAKLYAAERTDDDWLFLLEDLDAAGFSARLLDDTHSPALDLALGWLAAFHARFLDTTFPSLWPIGTYWHLATRRDELPNIRSRAIRDRADDLAATLDAARFQTLLHGDAKEANFCFTPDHTACAAVDFQYTGRGAGIRDVAYLLHGHHDGALDIYFRALRAALPSHVDAAALESEWRTLFPIAQQDFARFLAGWRG
jgi:Phosphotransferase enzyme family